MLALLPVVVALLVAGCGERGGGGARNGGDDGKYTVRLSHVSTTESAYGQAAEIFKRNLEEITNGRMTVEIFPNSTLYGQEDELQALQNGAVEMVMPTVSVLTAASPKFFLFDLPYVFRSTEDIMKILDKNTKIGKAFWENPDLVKRKMRPVGLGFSGFKQLTANKQIHSPADLKGLKMRVQPSDALRDMMRGWGANATPMPFAELYNGLQQGVVDGQDNPYTSIFTTKVYEVQKHLTETNHGYNFGPMLVNTDFFDSLPQDLQQAMLEAGEKTAPEALEVTDQINERDKKQIEESGKTKIFVPTEEQRAKFRDAVVPSLWDKWASRVGPELIDELKAYYGV